MPPQSKYPEIAQELLRRIIAGEFQEDGRLPSMQHLSREYSVNLLTIKRAVKVLEKQNIVKCHSGNRGTTINFERANSTGMVPMHHFAIDEALSDMPCVQLNFIHVTPMESSLKKISELFSQRYSWIKVNCIHDLKPQEAIRSDEHSYDIIETGVNNFPALTRNGRFIDLTETTGSTGKLTDAGYISNSLDFCRTNGRLFGIPFLWHTALVFKEEKQPLDSWDALESYLVQNHCKTSKVIFAVGLLTLLLSFLGGFDKLRSKTLAGKLKKFIRFIRVLIRNSELYSDFVRNGRKADTVKGMIGYYCSWWELAGQRHQHATPLPMNNGSKAMLHCTALAILSKTRHPQECWLWINFLQRPEIQDILNQEPYFFSARSSSFQRKDNNQELQATMEFCLENGEIMPVSTRGLFVFYTTALPFINQYLDDKLPEDALISELQDILETIIQLETMPQ
ncbi:MAG: GntR family transcriptional regulator [Lentisphaerae bacterium]|jgi:DNA-binding transcriptional regulator YhcF (GntR family)|nr:GntR family transcriptional regulator [Lentisphaerota bacterium]